MKLFNKKYALITVIFFCFSIGQSLAQKAPECVKAATTVRPTHVLATPHKLHNFYKNYHDEAVFENTKIVKSELAYYLLATEKNGPRIFAFELEQKRKKLFLNRKLPVQTCSEGTLSLDTFLQEDGKIKGCRMGGHTIRQGQ
ncbi:MAG: hypothetical protein K9J37_08270 [Saprospiraceae bacterium]|nr:hypothetical protein [Saprospiraceae bacterium]MCF8249895.1 hypothetical protein [Saprospiraceae bacterium]MCF8279308.1 hypothetical protein [Bacteroidales bacterium]MCF8309999.1 hypothetical protein [Saprospiraceae bacterium]MCF8438899.1 hypothetical protein [Saprospiraceae bacterium]